MLDRVVQDFLPVHSIRAEINVPYYNSLYLLINFSYKTTGMWRGLIILEPHPFFILPLGILRYGLECKLTTNMC